MNLKQNKTERDIAIVICILGAIGTLVYFFKKVNHGISFIDIINFLLAFSVWVLIGNYYDNKFKKESDKLINLLKMEFPELNELILKLERAKQQNIINENDFLNKLNSLIKTFSEKKSENEHETHKNELEKKITKDKIEKYETLKDLYESNLISETEYQNHIKGMDL